MPRHGTLDFSGDDAEKFMDMKPGKMMEFTVKAKFSSVHKDEFGINATFTIESIEDAASQDEMLEAALTELNSEPGV